MPRAVAPAPAQALRDEPGQFGARSDEVIAELGDQLADVEHGGRLLVPPHAPVTVLDPPSDRPLAGMVRPFQGRPLGPSVLDNRLRL